MLAGAFTVGPSLGLVGWTIWTLVGLALVIACVTRGRYGWAIVGVVTGGIGAIVGLALPPTERSLWVRRRRSPAHQAQ